MKINKLLLLLILFLQAFTVCGAIGFTNDNTVPTYHYYTQDHLGNNRAVVNDNGTVEQITHYYPFGGTYADMGLNSSLQPYKYNGKELDRMHGLNWYEYGHRQYDPIVPVFTKVDPDCEDYPYISPYAYCLNNPIRYLDPDGSVIVDGNNRIVSITQENGNLKFSNNATSSVIRIANALILSNTGRVQLNKLLDSDIKIHLEISNEIRDDGHSYTYGETIQGNYNKNDNYGTYFKNGKYGIKEASITIYEGSIKKSISQGSKLKHEGLDLEQAIGAVAGHETEHATNKAEIAKDKAAEAKGQLYRKREIIPNKVEEDIIEEYRSR